MMGDDNLDRNLVAILFPGIVKNDDKALECLGGVRNISHVHSKSNKRLGLSFQPDNPYIRKIYSEPKTTSGVLIKVRIKKCKINNELKKEVVSTTIIGRVKKVFKFDSLSEFQYLPVQTEGAGDGTPKCFLEDLLPTGLDTVDFLSKSVPLFIVPSVFTRTDRNVSYSYTDKKYITKEPNPETSDDVHQKKRAERGIPISRFVFNLTNNIPNSPPEHYLEQKRLKVAASPEIEKEFQIICELFKQRPIWSSNLIKYHTKLKLQSVKLLMPCLAFFIKDGPWRSSWVKYGYDPRKNPEARMYQILDFRVRHAGGIHSMVKKDVGPVNKKGDSVRSVAKRIRTARPTSNDEITLRHVIFKPGMIPPQRQIFFQICDLDIPEAKEMLSMDPPAGYMCHEKHGWLPPNAADTLRGHVFRYVKEAIISNNMKFEQDDSEGDLNSDDEIAGTLVSEVKTELGSMNPE